MCFSIFWNEMLRFCKLCLLILIFIFIIIKSIWMQITLILISILSCSLNNFPACTASKGNRCVTHQNQAIYQFIRSAVSSQYFSNAAELLEYNPTQQHSWVGRLQIDLSTLLSCWTVNQVFNLAELVQWKSTHQHSSVAATWSNTATQLSW